MECTQIGSTQEEETNNLDKDANQVLFFGLTAKSLMAKETFLSTGCSKMNAILRGGYARKGVTQIYGASGTGKTQLALQACLTVQLPIEEGGCKAGALYICTEATFPTRRLQELLRKSEIAQSFGATGDLIFVEHVSDIEELELCLTQKVPLLLAAHKIGLLVIDSIAAPYRVEYCSKQLKSRAKSLRCIGHNLHKFAADYNMTVICINQVTATVGNVNPGSVSTDEQPALGITWASMITNNLYLYRRASQRYLCVTQSPYVPRNTIQFTVSESGVTSIGL